MRGSRAVAEATGHELIPAERLRYLGGCKNGVDGLLKVVTMSASAFHAPGGRDLAPPATGVF